MDDSMSEAEVRSEEHPESELEELGPVKTILWCNISLWK